MDLVESREVNQEDGLNMAKAQRFGNFFETSAKTGQNIKELFTTITKHLYLKNRERLEKFVSFIMI